MITALATHGVGEHFVTGESLQRCHTLQLPIEARAIHYVDVCEALQRGVSILRRSGGRARARGRNPKVENRLPGLSFERSDVRIQTAKSALTSAVQKILPKRCRCAPGVRNIDNASTTKARTAQRERGNCGGGP
jgi:hypothetical protein